MGRQVHKLGNEKYNGVMFPYVQNLGNDPADASPVVVDYKPGIFQKVHYGSQGVVQIHFPLVAERNSDAYRNGASECPVPFLDALLSTTTSNVLGLAAIVLRGLFK